MVLMANQAAPLLAQLFKGRKKDKTKKKRIEIEKGDPWLNRDLLAKVLDTRDGSGVATQGSTPASRKQRQLSGKAFILACSLSLLTIA